MKRKGLAKLNSMLVCAVVIMALFTACFLVGCNDVEDDSIAPCVEHDFVRIDDATNREPTYDRDGRELRKCSICGITASFVLPKLEKLSGTLAENYLPLLDLYNVNYGDTLESVANKYFTTGWTFALEGETKVGYVSDEPYDYTAIFTPMDSMYAPVERVVKLKVNKAQLQETDVHLDVEIVIPTTVNSLDEIVISLLNTQEIPGTVAWVDGQEILRNQVAKYNYVFTPEDTDNYEIFVGEVLLKA